VELYQDDVVTRNANPERDQGMAWCGNPFFSHLYIKPMILPRQARGKHREKRNENENAASVLRRFFVMKLARCCQDRLGTKHIWNTQPQINPNRGVFFGRTTSLRSRLELFMAEPRGVTIR
jgi:hypothetical protein